MDIQAIGSMNIGTMQNLKGLQSVNVGGESAAMSSGWASNIGKVKNEAALQDRDTKGLRDISEVLGTQKGGYSGGSGGGGLMADDILKSIQHSQGKADTFNATHPFQLTTDERINNRPTIVGNEGMGSPSSIGDTISQMLENVHEKTVSYEDKSNDMFGKGNASPVDALKNEFGSGYSNLSGKVNEKKSEITQINESIEKYMGVMNDSYEYSIFTSMTIDVGKDVSQTATNLTKG